MNRSPKARRKQSAETSSIAASAGEVSVAGASSGAHHRGPLWLSAVLAGLIALLLMLNVCTGPAQPPNNSSTSQSSGKQTATPDAGPSQSDKTQRVTIAGQTFELELALTSNQRFRGLSGRKSIAENTGMLFVFADDQIEVQEFVMRDCFVPIDIIYLDADGAIVSMHRMKVEPPATRSNPWRNYSSGLPAQFAIELKGGTLDKLSLKPGDKIDLPYRKLAARAR